MRLRKKSSFLKRLVFGILLLLAVMSSAPLAAKWYISRALKADGYQVDISSLGINFFTGNVRIWGLNLSSSKGDRFNLVEGNIDFNVPKLFLGGVELEKVKIDGAVIDFTSEGDLMRAGGFNLQRLKTLLVGRLELNIKRFEVMNSEFCGFAKQQCLNVEAANVGRVGLSLIDDDWQLKHESTLVIEKAFLKNLTDEVAVLYFGNLHVSQASYSAKTFQLNELKLHNLQFIHNYSVDGGKTLSIAQTQIGELNVSKLDYLDGPKPEVLIGDVVAISPRQAFTKQVRKKQNLTTLHNWLGQAFDLISLGVKDTNQVRVALNHLSVKGGVLSWRDSLVVPAANETVTNIQLKVGAFDSAKPNMLAKLSMSSKLGDNGLAKFEGEVYPMGAEPNINGSVSIQDWDLSKIEAYTPSMFKQKVIKGTIDLSADVKLKNRHLDAQSRWQITAFKADKKGSALSNSMELLKDHNKSVRFALSIVGDTASDAVSVQHIFGTSIERQLKAMANGKMSNGNEKAKGELILTDNKKGKMAFRSLLYPANSREPARTDGDRLGEIAALLKNKPQLSLFFCPVSTGGEWAEIFNSNELPSQGLVLHDAEKATLMDLASARGKTLIQSLMDKGVFKSQVKICEPKIDLRQTGQSFVSISM